jgi:hypothetical protein
MPPLDQQMNGARYKEHPNAPFFCEKSNLMEVRLFRCVVLGCMFALAGVARASAADVIVYPGDDLAVLVKKFAPATKFVILRGKHYVGDIQPKDGQSFVGQPGAILSGAVRLGPFVRDGRLWRAKGPRPLEPSGGECEHADRSCLFGEVLFMDGAPLRRVFKLDELSNESWLQNRQTGDIFVGFEPAGRLVEISYRRAAFYGTAQDVTIRGLVVEQYSSTAQHGAIHATANDPEQKVLSTGWQILDNDIRFNSGGGVRTGNKMRLKGNRIYRNGQIGIVGAGTGIVVDSNDILANNALGYSAGWEAGATKFVVTDLLQVRNNCVRDNLGPGIWTDGENRNSTIADNWSVNNRGIGIFHEISGHALIEGNTVALNGSPGETPWNSQILISGSPDTLVQGNRVEVAPNYGHAIFIVEEGRASYVSRRNVVANNDITFYGSMGVSGFHSSHGRVEDLVENNRFEGNSIHVVRGMTTLRFRIGSDYLNLDQAQQRGQETRSRIDFVPSGPSPILDMKCPPGVGRREARR